MSNWYWQITRLWVKEGTTFYRVCVCVRETLYFTLAGSSTLCPPFCQLSNFPFVAAVGNFKFWHFWKQWPDRARLPLLHTPSCSCSLAVFLILPSSLSVIARSLPVTSAGQRALVSHTSAILSLLRRDDYHFHLKLVHLLYGTPSVIPLNCFCRFAQPVPFFSFFLVFFLLQMLHAAIFKK